MQYYLETKNLTKQYGKYKANDSINLMVRPNAIYGLLGPNGAGKSTLLKTITGMISQSSGEVYLGGNPMTRKDLASIGALIEHAPIYENLTARENVKLRALLYGLDDSRIDEVLQCVGLTDTGRKRAGQFSMGMKQRLGIAMALVNSPKLLILDEPTNGLDPLGIRELRALIRKLRDEGMTIIVSSHILSEIEQIADHVGIIVNGKLLYQEPLEGNENLEQCFLQIVEMEREANE